MIWMNITHDDPSAWGASAVAVAGETMSMGAVVLLAPESPPTRRRAYAQ
jgi:hypothetical protein